ncbi:MAG: peptidoglycan DD-metalloendopeptidase family protein [Actinomycetota bacterium]
MRAAICLVAGVVMISIAPAASASERWLIPPVDGVVERRYQAPEVSWGPGHRGIDYPAAPGTLVRAAGAGIVTFAGPVAGIQAVTVDHGDGLTSTYSSLSEVHVVRGASLEAGTWLGSAGEAHPGAGSGLHLGVKLDGRYVDPELYLGPVDASRAIMLAPLTWQPPEGPLFDVHVTLSARGETSCAPVDPGGDGAAPSSNIAVVVPGIGSESGVGSSKALQELAGRLGYPADAIYPFSYGGTSGPRLHRSYTSEDTFAEVERSAERLEELMAGIARTYPGRDVDLIAHSLGGIVARTFLQRSSSPWRGDLPRVAHLVTLSSPHSGAPLAGTVPALKEGAITGLGLDLVHRWAEGGGPVPDPYAEATRDLAPGSPLMEALATEDLVFGVRGLSLGIPNDIVVPADRAVLPEELHRTVPARGVNGHDGILGSAATVALAARFLRDGRDPCRTPVDRWGPLVGRLVSFEEAALPKALRLLGRLWP